jgi:serine/threonine-protein kinase
LSGSEQGTDDGRPDSVGTVLPGARFGDLRLVREIGRGAQGVVYEGRQLSMDRTVAVKIMPKDLTLGTEQVDRFHREAEAAGRLSHPNVVSVYGLEESGGHLLLMQEMVTGGTLADRIDEIGDVDGDTHDACIRSVELVLKLAAALHHAHEHGVIHRDIKPDNILFTADGEPKITDFGLARMDDKMGLSQTGAIMGTPHYMSPEQVTADPSAIDGRTDVYGLGSLLYRLLTGQPPFDGKSLQGIFNDILNREPKAPKSLRTGIPPDLEAVCLRALEKSPDERYATAGELAQDLGRFLAGESTMARPVSTLVRGFRSFQRQATSTLVVMVLLVPTAWIALDSLVLGPLATANDGQHVTRLGALALATALLAWPGTLLARRLLPRARLAAAIGVVLLAVALGVSGGMVMHDQRLTRLQAVDRTALSESLQQEWMAARLDVLDLEAFAERWGGRLEREDVLVLARGYLKRERPALAAAWVGRLEEGATGSPVHDALMVPIHEALGRVAEADAARGRLASAHAEAGWMDWVLAGDVLHDMERPTEARDAYMRAGRQPDAPRDRLNLDLARVSADLCAWDDVGEHLDDYRKWFPDDPECQLLLYRAAAGRMDWNGAELALSSYTSHESVVPARRVRLWHRFYVLEQRVDEAWSAVQDAMSEHADDASLLSWCAQQAMERSRSLLGDSATAAARGDSDGAATAKAGALDALGMAESIYERIRALEEGAFTGTIGLAATAMKRSELEPERRQELLEQSLSHAEAARDLDDSSWKSHYNVAHAQLSLARARYGRFADIPLETLREYVAHMSRAIALSGLDHQTLNNAAWVLGSYVHGQSGDDTDLEQALEFARRATWLTDPAREGGSCVVSQAARQAHSSSHDTLRTLQELAGDRVGALASARAARDALPFDDPRYATRVAQVQRLEQALEDG